MSNPDYIRFHAIGSEEESETIQSAFRDRFPMAYGEFTEYVGELDGEAVHSTRIIETGRTTARTSRTSSRSPRQRSPRRTSC